MNIANKLTLFRVFLVPIFIMSLLFLGINNILGFLIFVIASLTDMLDGYLARSRNLVTTFGKFMDPLADKILACSALVMLVQFGKVEAWMVCIVLAREFIISGFRLIAASNGIVISASIYGKIKTITQLFAISFILSFAMSSSLFFVFCQFKVNGSGHFICCHDLHPDFLT